MNKFVSAVDRATALFLEAEAKELDRVEQLRGFFFEQLTMVDLTAFEVSEKVTPIVQGGKVLMRVYELNNPCSDATIVSLKMSGIRPLRPGTFSQDGIMMADLFMNHKDRDFRTTGMFKS